MHIKERMNQLKTDIPAIYLAIKDPRTPWISKILGVWTIFYALSPVDLIPDFIPVLGLLDDLIILPVLIVFTIKFIPNNIIEEYRVKSKDLWKNGKPKKWLYALPFIFFWVLIIFLVINKWFI